MQTSKEFKPSDAVVTVAVDGAKPDVVAGFIEERRYNGWLTLDEVEAMASDEKVMLIAPIITLELVQDVKALREQNSKEHELAGITINFEMQAMQAVGMAHGVMASMLMAKELFGEDSEHYSQFEAKSQDRIAQCFVALVEMGIDSTTANERIIRGY